MRGRGLRFAWIIGGLLLIGVIGVPAYLWNKSKSEPVINGADRPLDLVCIGRIDTKIPVSPLDPFQPGRVVKVFVAEGAVVRAGQEILAIDNRMYDDAIREAELALDGAKLQAAIAEQAEMLHASELESLARELEAAEAGARGLEIKLRQMQSALSHTDRVPYTAADLQVTEASLIAERKKIEAARMRLEDRRKLDLSLEVKAAQVKIQAAQNAIEKYRRHKDDCIVRAPADGTIIRIQAAPGAMLAPGASLEPPIIFAPAGPLIVRAEVDQADAGRIAPGQKAVMIDDSRRDSPEWTGTVIDVSAWIARKRSFITDPGEFNDVRTLEAIIELDPTPDRLWIGQRMVVRVQP